MPARSHMIFYRQAGQSAIRGAARPDGALPQLLLRALLVGGLAAFSLQGGEPPNFSLLPAVTVDRAGVHLHQLLAAPAGLVPTNLWLLPAPAPGKPCRLSRADLVALLQTNAPDFAAATFSGAPSVLISRRTRPLPETEIAALLREPLSREFQCPPEHLELKVLRLPVPVQVPDEPFSLKLIELPATGPSASFLLRFELRGDTELFGAWQAAVQARVWKEIYVTTAPLKRGQPLERQALSLERRDVLALRDVLDALPAEPEALEITENLPAGVPLTRRALRLKPILSRGQLVRGLVQDGALSIALKVEVLEDGAPGQWIRVRNPQSKRELRGKVQDEQTVLIVL
ncbi:MAG: flagellar basal body P-ring formation chaperone FlgA [Verrucomicrobiae bacterium]|nr:flagellar basal body P-ring formation chaperone FlgA [Verrucomicrobiae bacterium]